MSAASLQRASDGLEFGLLRASPVVFHLRLRGATGGKSIATQGVCIHVCVGLPRTIGCADAQSSCAVERPCAVHKVCVAGGGGRGTSSVIPDRHSAVRPSSVAYGRSEP